MAQEGRGNGLANYGSGALRFLRAWRRARRALRHLTIFVATPPPSPLEVEYCPQKK